MISTLSILKPMPKNVFDVQKLKFIIKITNYMKIIEREIKRSIVKEYNCVLLTIPHPYEDILDIVSFPDHEGWTALNLGEKYMVERVKDEVLRFDYLFVLQDTDHADLLEIIQNALSNFKGYELEYPKVYQKYMQKFREQIDFMDNCFLNPIQQGAEVNKFTFYFFEESQNGQEIQSRLERLKQFKKELLIFPFYDRMRSQFKLEIHQVPHFLKSLLKNYEEKLIQACRLKMQKIGLGLGAIIQNIQPYIRRQSEYKFPNLDTDAGIIITIHGFQETFCKIYGFFERWIENLNTAILQMPYIQCCEIQSLPCYYEKSYRNSHAIVLSSKKPIRILLLEPPNRKDQDEIMQFFLRSKRIISGLQFQKFNFKKLKELKEKFLCFLQETCFKHKVDVYNDYIVTKCSRAEENKLRELIGCFLENYIEQEVMVDNFKDPFQISIFEAVYCANYLKRGNYVKFYKLGKCLYRLNYKKDAEEIQSQLRQFQLKIRKQLTLVPVVRSPPSSKLYFKELSAKQWENPKFLYSQMFVIGHKVKLNLRNYISISKNEEECIFIIQGNRSKQCHQLIHLLQQQGCSNIDKKLSQNPIMGFSLRNSRYFDDITSFKLPLIDEKDTRKMLHLKESIHNLINDFKSRHLKIVLPQNSDRSVKLLLPIVIEYVLTILNLRSESKINEITFFVSKSESQYTPLVESLQGLRNRLQIVRKTSLYLRTGDISKIITYGYYSLKYFQNNQNGEASNLNSFIFQFNLRKKKKTPIFLPLPTEQNFKCEYLVSCSTNRVHQIRNYFIKEVGEQISDKLKAIREIIKKYFQNAEYFVISGNNEGTQFTENLYYTSSSENHYKHLERVSLNIEKGTVMSSKEKLVRFELTKSQFLSLKMVETHKSKQLQLLEDMSLIPLM